MLPEKTSTRKNSKRWVDIERKNAASKNTGLDFFFKIDMTKASSKFESKSKLVRKMLSWKKKRFIKSNYNWNPTTTAGNFSICMMTYYLLPKTTTRKKKNINVAEFIDFFAKSGEK